jgi:hypothetical protein
MSDAPEVTFEKPTPKKPAKKGRRSPRRASFQKPSAPFPGLTRMECATACNANACAISQKPYCAHPTKGGLQGSDMSNAEALKRIQKARDQINVKLDPDRFK